jgi:hypothetical protein
MGVKGKASRVFKKMSDRNLRQTGQLAVAVQRDGLSRFEERLKAAQDGLPTFRDFAEQSAAGLKTFVRGDEFDNAQGL